MSREINERLWCISLLFAGLFGMVVGLSNIVGFELPDMLKRILGVLMLLDLFFLSFATVRKFKK